MSWTTTRDSFPDTVSGGSGYATVEDEATPLTQRSTVNFAGAGVTATDSGGKTLVTIPGGSSGYATFQEEGSSQTQRSTVDFVGEGATVSDTGSKTQVSIPGTIVVATTVAGLGTAASGKRGLLRIGSTPYQLIGLVYDSTYGKWVSEMQHMVCAPVKDSAITSTVTTYGAFSDAEVTRAFIPNLKAILDAGLTPEVNIVCQMSNNTAGQTTFMRASFADFDDGDLTIVTLSTGAEISVVGSSALYRVSGWTAIATTATQTHGQVLLQRKVSASTGNYGVPGLSLRWVG